MKLAIASMRPMARPAARRGALPCLRALCTALLALAAQPDVRAAEQVVATAASSANLDAAPILFTASFSAPAWTGTVVASQVQGNGAPAALWDAARDLDRLPDAAVASRVVLSTGVTGAALSLHWPAMTLAERASLSAQGINEARLDYLRGDRRREMGAGGGGTLRPRQSRLGDIVNSNIWFVGVRRAKPVGSPARPTMVYVGANDGMLHGFAVENGAEKVAYVPRAALPRLSRLADPAYTHAYYVDGPVFAGDAAPGGGEPRTFLVAGLGSGGRGFVVLDVSDPGQFTAINAASIVHVDRSGDNDADIGQISSPPVVDAADPNRSRQVVRMNNGRWAVVMGNGHSSANESPVLLIQYLDDLNRDKTTGARELLKISPCAASGPCVYRGGNGLAAPQLIDVDGDGRVDLAYAGDLQGNVWKFDLSSANDGADPASAWRVSFGGRPFFIARDADGKRQAITTAPHWMPHPRGGIMLAIGTGRNLDGKDRESKSTNTVYGLYDDSAMTLDKGAVAIKDTLPIHAAADTEPRSTALVVQTFGGEVRDGSFAYRSSTSRPVDYNGVPARRGWLIDLPTPGERVLHNLRSLQGQRFIVQGTVPTPLMPGQAAAEVMPRTSGTSTISVLNMLTGQPPAQQVFVTGDASLAAAGLSMVSVPAGPVLQSRQGGQTILQSPGQPDIVLRGAAPAGMRAGWREVR